MKMVRREITHIIFNLRESLPIIKPYKTTISDSIHKKMDGVLDPVERITHTSDIFDTKRFNRNIEIKR